eukprot:10676249-Heterocapsa_arctica.AAC.1
MAGRREDLREEIGGIASVPTHSTVRRPSHSWSCNQSCRTWRCFSLPTPRRAMIVRAAEQLLKRVSGA